ncbi:MAG TPA: hypothetical protein VGD02_08910, partial [Gemmatimonadaceae bacterium]
MNAARWQEIRAGFDAIVDLDARAREGRMAELADSDPELHHALELLLKADAEVSGNLGMRAAHLVSDGDHPTDLLGISGRTISHFDVGEV